MHEICWLTNNIPDLWYNIRKKNLQGNIWTLLNSDVYISHHELMFNGNALNSSVKSAWICSPFLSCACVPPVHSGAFVPCCIMGAVQHLCTGGRAQALSARSAAPAQLGFLRAPKARHRSGTFSPCRLISPSSCSSVSAATGSHTGPGMRTFPKNRSCDVYSISGLGHCGSADSPGQVRMTLSAQQREKTACSAFLKGRKTRRELCVKAYIVQYRANMV